MSSCGYKPDFEFGSNGARTHPYKFISLLNSEDRVLNFS
jgi:hypothetical protein